jgi:hypothetical protein
MHEYEYYIYDQPGEVYNFTTYNQNKHRSLHFNLS